MPVRPDRHDGPTARPSFAWAVPPLGDGTLTRRGIGPKAALLDRAAAAGLPVPRGVVIPDGVAPPSAKALSLRAPLAVRSAFSAEDGHHRSMAGAFRSELHVAAADVAAAVARVRASADGHPGPLRRDVLVMEQVDARHAGVAATEQDHGTDVVNVVAGLADRLLGGAEQGDRVTLRRLRSRRDRADAAEPWQRRLQALLRDVRRVVGDGDWDVEWADDGAVCWLVQVRPLTRPVRRAEVLTIANHAEILPPLPSPFMTSLIGRCAPDLFAWYRRIDPTLPAGRPFIHIVGGRPFINLSLLEEMLASWGLPTRLVADGFGGEPAHDEPLRPLLVARRSPTLVRMAAAQAGAVRGARRRAAQAAAVGGGGAASFSTAVAQAAEAYTLLVTGMFPLSSALGPPVTLLRRAGTLTAHAGAHRTVTTALADDLAAVRAGTLAPEVFLERFGHRGVYESDIARPRFVDDPPAVAPATAPHAPRRGPRPRNGPRRWRTWRVAVTAPLWWVTRPALDAREHLRHEAMRGFLTVRRSLLRLARAAEADGRLPSEAHLWQLTVDEAIRLDDGWRPDPAFWTARAAELATLATLRPPTLVRSTDDPADWADTVADAPPADRVRGLGLTAGTVRGRAWVLHEPALALPDGFSPATTVLVARSVDAGWIPTFGLVAAVAVETGGDLSHGSIVLRELGVPAATNLPGVTRLVTTGDEVELRADSGTLERLTPR